MRMWHLLTKLTLPQGESRGLPGAKEEKREWRTTKSEFRSIVIFGGAGFIGSNWTERLLRTTEAKVHVFDNLSRQGSRHNLEYLQKAAGRTGRLQITVGDVRDVEMVSRVVKYATEIYNFAAQVAVTTSLADPRLDFEVNLGGTFNILEAARQHGQNPYLLFTSTNKVYGNSGDGEVRAAGYSLCGDWA